MAPAVADKVLSLHDYEGICDYCGETCDSTVDELNAITCSFEQCPNPAVYHQHCVETYLKSIRLDKQRKTGFSCPRGSGKATKYDKICPGRVQKSHPIHARNDNSKKRRKAQLPEALQLAAVKKAPLGNKTKEPLTPKDKAKAKVTPVKPPPSKGQLSPSATPAGSSKVFSRPASEHQGARPEVLVVRNRNIASSREVVKPAIVGRGDKGLQALGSGLESDEEDEGPAPPRGSASLADFAITVAKSKRPAPSQPPNAWASNRRAAERPGAEQPVPQVPSAKVTQKLPQPTIPTPQPVPLVRPMSPGGRTMAEIVGMAAAAEEESKKAAKNQKKHQQRAAVRQRERQGSLDGSDGPSSPGSGGSAPLAAPPSPVLGPSLLPPAAPVSATQTAAGSGPLAAVAPLASPPLRSQESLKEARSDVLQWSDRLLTALKEAKIPIYAKQLQELGFPEWQCTTAVRVCGSDLNKCCDWLMSDNKGSLVPKVAVIDVSAEVSRLAAIMVEESLSKDAVELAVVSCSGDIDAALLQLKGAALPGKAAAAGPSQGKGVAAALDPVVSRPGSSSSSSQSGSLWEQPLRLDSKAKEDESLFSGFNPFGASSFVSNLARYNALLGMTDDGEAEGQQGAFSQSSLSSGFGEDLFGTSASSKDALYAEATQSTVSSVAAAVLDEPVGGYIPSGFSATSEKTSLSSFASPAVATTPGNDIWGFNSSKGLLGGLGYSLGQAVGPMPSVSSLFSTGPSAGGSSQAPKPDWGTNGYRTGQPGGWYSSHAPASGFENDQDMLVAQLVSQLLV